ncbi:pyroglutamyl-peptidase I [Candidatus Enterococcus mansonii]|uniref:Pyrrolidone-carboxylate peptidase n=1 Tax=Candidatus Enterococcus mansonii TaxID=1834181 RepID=A0A242CIS1_9ENTE|nr:pyroglutamyl-peptidase I [Enterococcus sp. 4G2_DIV0659]OTO10135.1 pyroglutamyl-peptidase I [Enterococcus sp. 4G2_DIV0659]
MNVLVTGFDPFDGATVNPAYEAVKRLPDEIAGAKVIKLEVPTVFKESSSRLKAALKLHKPDIVICVGQAGGRSAISLEQVAINLAEARIPDNQGNQPSGERLEEDGDTAYFTTLPIKAMMKNVQDHGLPATISYTAGTFVCNEIMYRLLYMIDKEDLNIKGGFIHVPFEPSQVIERPTISSMPILTIANSLLYAIEAAVTTEIDSKINTGTTH